MVENFVDSGKKSNKEKEKFNLITETYIKEIVDLQIIFLKVFFINRMLNIQDNFQMVY